MHIPDGFLDGRTMVATAALSAGGLALALRQLKRRLPRRRVPLMGLAAAFVFAAQILNFPIAGGTSGHLLGSVLIAVLLGPSAAVLVLATVLIVQCLMFADGGLLALGANIFNMGIVGGVGGYAIYRCVQRLARGPRGVIMGAAFAAWCSAVMAAVLVAGELAISGTAQWAVVFPAMVNVHLLIGLGEAAITVLVIVAIQHTQPELIDPSAPAGGALSRRQILGYGLLISLGLALFVSPFACTWPDGLEKVAGALGFANRAVRAPAPLANYRLSWIKSAPLGTSLAGAAGTVLVFILAFFVARVVTPRRANDSR
ncbi:MAG: energy-coupling factor ABC transporter permease [Opitutaceae bacterium]|jgi:cobalt/nickel transport system permease protein